MAKYLGLKWQADQAAWLIKFRGRKPHQVADDLLSWADHSGDVLDGDTVALARVPSGVVPEVFVGNLPPPDISACPLCRARKAHSVHKVVTVH